MLCIQIWQVNEYSKQFPSYEFHFEELSNVNASVEGLVQIQDISPRYRNEIQNSY